MKRREFIRTGLGAVSLFALNFELPGLLPTAGRRDLVERFAAPCTRGDWLELWLELVEGYAAALTPGRAWGSIVPEGDRQRWLQAPEGRRGDPELVSRMLWSLSGWFARPGRAKRLKHGKGVVDLQRLMVDGVAHATDPEHEDYWDLGFAWGAKNGNQYSVEAPPMGLAALASVASFPDDLPKDFAANAAEWLRLPATGHRSNNWNLFHALAAVTRERLGFEIDEEILRENLASCLAMYRGEGAFSDGEGVKYDDYSYWVFATHFGLWWEYDRARHPDIAAKIPAIIRDVTAHQPYSLGRDGSHPEYGRSITYKFARLASLVQAHRLGFSKVSPGLIRRAVRLHVHHYLGNGAIDLANKRILQTLSGQGSLRIREVYNYPGSTYWTMQTFGELWRLADDDPFWTAEEEPLPVERSSFVHPMPTQGWKTVGTKETGSVILINHAVDMAKGWAEPSYRAKYSKQAYHSHLGFVVGTLAYVPCDQMAVLRIESRSHYPVIEDWDRELPEIGRRREAFGAALPGLTLDHLILPVGETLFRVTRIVTPKELPEDAVLHLGGYALGFSDERPKVTRGKDLISVAGDRGQSILCIMPVPESELTIEDEGYLGETDFHTRERFFLLPHQILRLQAGRTIHLCQASRGSRAPIDPEDWRAGFDFEIEEDVVRIRVGEKIHRIEF